MLSISKELFVHACKVIEKKSGDAEALCEALELCSPQEQVNAFIYSEYEDLVTSLLHEAIGFGEGDDLLEWWMWDKEMGKAFELGDYEDNGEQVDLSTPEKFYDYVASRAEEENSRE